MCRMAEIRYTKYIQQKKFHCSQIYCWITILIGFAVFLSRTELEIGKETKVLTTTNRQKKTRNEVLILGIMIYFILIFKKLNFCFRSILLKEGCLLRSCMVKDSGLCQA